MEELRARLVQARERFDALSPRAKAGFLAAIGALLAVGVLAYAYGSEPSREVLFSNLSEHDAGRIAERLGAMGIEHELEGGGTIRVAADRVHDARLTLASEGLPGGGAVGFEIFDTQRFGESDFSEQIQYRRALEGELGRTIGHLAGVESARVHLVLPERTLFVSDAGQATASVALQLRPGWRLRAEQVQGVSHLVASSVPGLSPDDVTVVDGEGQALAGSGDSSRAVASDAEELRVQIERSKQLAVQQLLDASLGPGVAFVRVSADVSLSTEEHMQETYDPERTATRSFEVEEARDPDAESEGTQGVPGAASNLPGGAAAEQTAGQAGMTRRTERRNFEVTKTVSREVRPVGRLSRLTVAVVVDGIWEGVAPDRAFTPRDDEEITRISALVSSAAGIQDARGDVVTVECVPFASSSAPPEEPLADPLAPLVPYQPYFEPAAIAGGVLLALFIAFVLWIKWRLGAKKRKKAADAERVRRLEAGDVDQLPTPTLLDAAADVASDVDEVREKKERTLADYEQLRALALEVARRDPELAARAVSGWLAEDVRAAAKADADQEAA